MNKKIYERKIPDSPTGEAPQSKIMKFYRRPDGEKCVKIVKKTHGEIIIEEFLWSEVDEMFENA